MEKIQRNAKQGNIYVERLKTIILYKTHQQWKHKTVWKTMKYLRKEQSTIASLYSQVAQVQTMSWTKQIC